MGLDLDYKDGQTPLEEEEKDGLRISSIASRNDLNEYEQHNIEQAILWTMTKKFNIESILTEQFIRLVHKQMFNQVWSWAGEFRKTNKNIGVDKWQIPSELKYLLEDCQFWFKHNTFTPDEFAIRFKHRIVTIHCFPNGNGRHSRLMADILIENIYKKPFFSWGIGRNPDEARKVYLQALKKADNGDYQDLIAFARS